MILCGPVKRTSQHRAAPPPRLISFDRVSNDNVFQWTEEVNPSNMLAVHEAEADEPLRYKYQIWGKVDRDPEYPDDDKTDSVEVACGM